jgi:hypothetical protein
MSATDQTFYPARIISAAEGVCSRSVHRRASRERWPTAKRGNRLEYAPPRRLRRSCAALVKVTPIWQQPRTLRELLRAAAVLGFCLRVRREPARGTRAAFRQTAADLRRLFKFSPTALERWVSGVARDGLAALRENKLGRVGRKSARLERIL